MPLLSSSVMDPSSPGEMRLLEGTAKPSRPRETEREKRERERERERQRQRSILICCEHFYRGSHAFEARNVQEELKSVERIESTCAAFAALLVGGSVVTWGDPSCGGDSNTVKERAVVLRKGCFPLCFRFRTMYAESLRSSSLFASLSFAHLLSCLAVSRIPGAASGCAPHPQHLLRFRSPPQRRKGGDLGLSCSRRGQQLGFGGAEGCQSVSSSALGSPACKRA